MSGLHVIQVTSNEGSKAVASDSKVKSFGDVETVVSKFLAINVILRPHTDVFSFEKNESLDVNKNTVIKFGPSYQVILTDSETRYSIFVALVR